MVEYIFEASHTKIGILACSSAATKIYKEIASEGKSSYFEILLNCLP